MSRDIFSGRCASIVPYIENPDCHASLRTVSQRRRKANRSQEAHHLNGIPANADEYLLLGCCAGRRRRRPLREEQLRADMESAPTEENTLVKKPGCYIFRRILYRGRFSAFPQGMLGRHHSKDWQDTHRYAPRQRRSYRSFREGSRYPHPG